jgi:hypothetical protein
MSINGNPFRSDPSGVSKVLGVVKSAAGAIGKPIKSRLDEKAKDRADAQNKNLSEAQNANSYKQVKGVMKASAKQDRKLEKLKGKQELKKMRLTAEIAGTAKAGTRRSVSSGSLKISQTQAGTSPRTAKPKTTTTSSASKARTPRKQPTAGNPASVKNRPRGK